MLHASTRKLIDRLAEMTELGKLDWTEDEAGNIAYATEGYSVSLTEDPGEVIITSKDGKELERATAEEIAATQQEDGTSYTTVVAAMGKEAARIARGTEAAISTLLAGMDDAPETVEAESDLAEDTETLQEDPVDDTTVFAAAPIDTASEEDTSSETAETEVDETFDAATEESADEEVIAEETEAEPEPEFEASDDSTTEEFESTEDATVEPEEDEIEAAAIVQDEVSTDSADTESESEMLADSDPVEMQDEASNEESSDETEPEATFATFETESEPEAVLNAELESDAETVADAFDVETETEVTEAVARMADEVKSREDTGLESAAASAVGAVALAAGLSLQDDESTSEEAEEATVSETAPETVEDVTEPLVAESSEPPAYVPFGLNDVEETVQEDAAFTETAETVEATEPEFVAEVEEPLASMVEVEPEVEDVDSPLDTLEQMTEDVFASRNELEGIESTAAPIEAEPEPAQLIENSPIAAFAGTSKPFEAESIAEPEPVAAEPTPDALSDVVEVAYAEPELETVTATADAEAPSGNTYSLSGIGAGFGLGALSAKTEASGIPGPSTPSVETGEKVVIDATDDVLPKLEGNLNVSLAETASAAVSSANAAAEPGSPADEATDSEADILKPRTRFNPWD
ncbi:MAG: hypothetical protein AAF269_03945 [Pseudomonadota bacterium]